MNPIEGTAALLRNSLTLWSGKAEVLQNLMQGATNENVIYLVKTENTSVVVPGGQIKCINSTVKTDPQEENHLLDYGFKMTCQLVKMYCSSRKANIYVRNTMHPDITIPAKTLTQRG